MNDSSSAPIPARAPSTSASALYLCPACHAVTRSLKNFRLYRVFLFLIVAGGSQAADYTACPSCMRKIIAKLTILNLVPANLPWPVVLAVQGAQFVRTSWQGPSKYVSSAFRLS